MPRVSRCNQVSIVFKLFCVEYCFREDTFRISSVRLQLSFEAVAARKILEEVEKNEIRGWFHFIDFGQKPFTIYKAYALDDLCGACLFPQFLKVR
jgi:hypothetical protein